MAINEFTPEKYFKPELPLMCSTDFTHNPSVQSIRLNCSPSVNLLESNGSSQNSRILLHDQHFKGQTKI